MGDANMTTPPQAPSSDSAQEPKFGGFTRFEIELEFVQSLGNPHYVSHLATLNAPSSLQDNADTSTDSRSKADAPTPLLQHPPFVAYLSYLQYFSTPQYVKYLMYPGPTLKMLELLQSEKFRREIMSPDVVAALVDGGVKGTERWVRGDD